MRSSVLTFLTNIPFRDLILLLSAFGLGTIFAGLTNSSDSVSCTTLSLKEAEANWQRNSRKILQTEKLIPKGKLPNQAKFSYQETYDMIWDYFPSTFDCPFTTERLGRVGDGGKWVCGVRELAQQPQCVVYSFGIQDDTSFEEDILSRTACRVHMFDPTTSADRLPILNRFPERVTFTPIGIGATNTSGAETLDTLMQRNGDSFADILKMDVEGAEWLVLGRILLLAGSPPQLPFSQLQVEVHLNSFNAELQYERMRSLWTSLHQAGLRPFHDEPNLVAGDKGVFLFHEFAFINTKSTKSPFYVPA